MATAAFALAGVAAATFAATLAATVAASLPLLLLLLFDPLDPLCVLPAQPLDASLFALPPLFGSPGSTLPFALAVVVIEGLFAARRPAAPILLEIGDPATPGNAARRFINPLRPVAPLHHGVGAPALPRLRTDLRRLGVAAR